MFQECMDSLTQSTCLFANWIALHPIKVDCAVPNLVEELTPQQLPNEGHWRQTVFLLCAEDLQAQESWWAFAMTRNRQSPRR